MPVVRIVREHDVVGVICRGGPVNGPYSAAALATLSRGLAEKGVSITHIYGNSASAPSAVLAAIGGADSACDIWASIGPEDLIVRPDTWYRKARTMRNVLYGEAVFDGSPMEALIRAVTPLDKVFAPEAVAVKLMAVDYLTGKPVVASNKNPLHRWNYHACILGSMALTPFLKNHIVYDVVEAELLDEPWTRVGPYRDVAVLFDGGFTDNLMFDDACRDGCTVVFVVDINGLQLGPLTTHKWDHWANTLQRAFHVLVTTNDNRRYSGVERTNEILVIRDELRTLASGRAVSKRTAKRLGSLIDRMDEALELTGKHVVQSVMVEDPSGRRPFDFASFTHEESVHLLHSGHQAAARALQSVEVV